MLEVLQSMENEVGEEHPGDQATSAASSGQIGERQRGQEREEWRSLEHVSELDRSGEVEQYEDARGPDPHRQSAMNGIDVERR